MPTVGARVYPDRLNKASYADFQIPRPSQSLGPTLWPPDVAYWQRFEATGLVATEEGLQMRLPARHRHGRAIVLRLCWLQSLAADVMGSASDPTSPRRLTILPPVLARTTTPAASSHRATRCREHRRPDKRCASIQPVAFKIFQKADCHVAEAVAAMVYNHGRRTSNPLRSAGSSAPAQFHLVGSIPTAQISIFEPSSTTALFGSPRKSAAALALWCICAYSFSRHCAIPAPMVGTTTSRERK